MFLEKIRQHAGKLLFFSVNVLLIALGAAFLKQKALEKDLADAKAENSELVNAQNMLGRVSQVQEDIAADRQQKLEGVANNSGTVTVERTVPVTKTVPGAVRTVQVPDTKSGTTTSVKSTSSSAKTTKTS